MSATFCHVLYRTHRVTRVSVFRLCVLYPCCPELLLDALNTSTSRFHGDSRCAYILPQFHLRIFAHLRVHFDLTRPSAKLPRRSACCAFRFPLLSFCIPLVRRSVFPSFSTILRPVLVICNCLLSIRVLLFPPFPHLLARPRDIHLRRRPCFCVPAYQCYGIRP